MFEFISEYKQDGFHSPENAIENREELRESGSGSFSKVYIDMNQNIAIKLLYSSDDGFDAYVDAIKQTAENPLYPIVHKVITLDTGQVAYIMEKLFHIEYFDGTTQCYFEQEIQEIQEAAWKQKFDNINYYQWDAIQTILLAEMFAKDKGASVAPDLHKGNFMARDKNTLVIIDPLKDYAALEYNEMNGMEYDSWYSE